MTDREKLIELIVQKQDCGLTHNPKGQDFVTFNAELADHLIANGVTVRNRGRWIIHPSGRSKDAPKYAECSYCHTTGSPQWKSCPVCDSLMEG